MAGMKVVPVKVLSTGFLDLNDLKLKAEQHKDNLAAFMVTYPSTYGVFEGGVEGACDIIHQNGGQVYLDGPFSSSPPPELLRTLHVLIRLSLLN